MVVSCCDVDIESARCVMEGALEETNREGTHPNSTGWLNRKHSPRVKIKGSGDCAENNIVWCPVSNVEEEYSGGHGDGPIWWSPALTKFEEG